MAVATLPTSPKASAASPHALTPVHRLGEQIFEIVADIGDMAVFAAVTFSWMFRRRPRMVGAGPQLLRDRRLERAGRRHHGDVHRDGPGGAGAQPVRDDGPGDAAGLGHQHLAGQGARAGAGGDDARRPRRLVDVGRAGDDARHRADRRPLGPGDQSDPLPGRPPVPRLLPADPAADPDGRLHGGDRRGGRQHADPHGRFVRLLAALARVRRGHRPVRRGVQELLLRRGDRVDQLSSRLQLPGGRRGRRSGGDRGVCLLVHRHPVSRLLHRDRLEQRVFGHLAPTRRTSYERGRCPAPAGRAARSSSCST